MKLNQVTIPSLDVFKAIEFYQTLGLKLIVHSHENYARFICPEGQATFSIHKVATLPSGDGISVYFECEHLDKRVEELKQKGIEFEQDPKDQPWLWREAHLRDLDGNRIILYHAGKNRVDPPWRLP